MRWIFLSHDDVDHSGNLDEVMTACPNAQLVCNWAMIERHTNCFDFPLERCRWVMDGETLDIGDRRCTRSARRCTTRRRPAGCSTRRPACTGRSTRSPRRSPTRRWAIADLDAEFWDDGLTLFALGAVSPWLSMVDHDKYGRYVDRSQSLDITTIAACHSPVIEGPFIEQRLRTDPAARRRSTRRRCPTSRCSTRSSPPRHNRRPDIETIAWKAAVGLTGVSRGQAHPRPRR